MNKITIIGAGKTGRGFLADIIGGQEITFIDKNKDLVDKLRADGKFEIYYFGDKKPKKEVRFKAAYTWEDVTEIDADLIFVSVGGSNLPEVGAALKRFIKAGQQIIVCENASHPARMLGEAIGIDSVNISESTVFCTTIEKAGLDIHSEGYPYLQFDAEPMKNNLPAVQNLRPIENFGNFLTRKLYTYNSASCIIAYLGYIKGYTVYGEAANDAEILALLDQNYELMNDCMCREFGYEAEDQREFAILSRKKFTDRTIADTVSRNAREPQRKLKAAERILGPLMLAEKYGADTTVLALTTAAALLYSDPSDGEWERLRAEKGIEGVMKDICGLKESDRLYADILQKYAFLKDKVGKKGPILSGLFVPMQR